MVEVFREYQVFEDTLQANLLREIEILRMLRHRNIVSLEGSFWDMSKLYICMELVEGQALLKLVPRGGMPEDTAKDFFFQLCSAVAFCHSHNVRDFSVFLSSSLISCPLLRLSMAI